MSKLNSSQKAIAETLDGMVVVDAGPGTGKTETLTVRYMNIISQPDVSPKDVLLLTFTRNAAVEMEDRIKLKLLKEGDKEMKEKSKLVQAKTFDSFCFNILMDSPEEAGALLGIEERLTRNAAISANETLDRRHFESFLDRFLHERGEDYGDWEIIASQFPESLMKIVNRLMSRGILPLKTGWFGVDGEKELWGDIGWVEETLKSMNVKGPRGGASPVAGAIEKAEKGSLCNPPAIIDRTVDPDAIPIAAEDPSREGMLALVHDVYREYIRTCISEDRLTFGINSVLAFALLYGNPGIRSRNSFKYLMIDEFQDTNANQLMIALMVLSHPNLCVVGDWKQGIYGFRYVSIENIISFEERVTALRRFLNDDVTRIPFQIPEVTKLSLDTNYRSSEKIIEESFRCLYLKATDKEKVDAEELDRIVVCLSQGRTDITDDDTEIRYAAAGSKKDEPALVARTVRDYVHSGRYSVVDNETRTPLGYGDIAVLCRTTAACRAVMDRLQEEGIPAFMQGDVEIMSTREGKLALAWLRYVNNDKDPWGYIPILADMNYTLADCVIAQKDYTKVPGQIQQQRELLFKKKRRVTEMLTTLFSYYGLDNDITQAIISTLSTAHRGSLMTISDLISMIEDGIEKKATYPVENSADIEAVKVMTMHKAKGLEFPAVIIPYLDAKTMPNTNGDKEKFRFDSRLGLRCSVEVGHFDGYDKICDSWRAKMARVTGSGEYDEERRLLFVAVSRAKQYVTMICGDKPSKFMLGLSDGSFSTIPDVPISGSETSSALIERPEIPDYPPRRVRLGVHTLMIFNKDDGQGGMAKNDEFSGKGKEYGDAVHRAAEDLFNGIRPREEYPELEQVRKVLNDTSDADLRYCEMSCVLPVPGTDVSLAGIIDLIAVYPDRIEIHDYKTDAEPRFEAEYEFQLSVYAHAASAYYGRPAVCCIDYVSMGRDKRFSPLPMESIRQRVETFDDGTVDSSRKTSAQP